MAGEMQREAEERASTGETMAGEMQREAEERASTGEVDGSIPNQLEIGARSVSAGEVDGSIPNQLEIGARSVSTGEVDERAFAEENEAAAGCMPKWGVVLREVVGENTVRRVRADRISLDGRQGNDTVRSITGRGVGTTKRGSPPRGSTAFPVDAVGISRHAFLDMMKSPVGDEGSSSESLSGTKDVVSSNWRLRRAMM
jgi:hypothetical protein